MKNLILTLSLVANLYMQFNYEIFSFYANHKYCEGKGIDSMGMSTYGFSINNYYISPFNILKLAEKENRSLVIECTNGFKIKGDLNANQE